LTPQAFTGSALFEKTFEEGMSLVEKPRAISRRRGRQESKDLPRKIADALCGESMRVNDAADAGGELALGAARGA